MDFLVPGNLPFSVEKKGIAIIFVGIQASGKTTFYNSFLSGICHINLDTLRSRGKEKQLLDECVANFDSFVVDNTNFSKSDRERYIPLAKVHGYRIIGIFFQSRLSDCIQRNEGRDRKVPKCAIISTQKQLEFPSQDEGFDEIFFVRISETGFEIDNWRD
ncbi:MAG: AAA family ATPase [Paludibacteraceae bacterium]|nr:AAA family ATPase [Paludibacteraceae bacterium]